MNKLVLICALSFTGGCSLAPEYQRPTIPVPSAYQLPTETAGTSEQAIDAARFADTRLRRLIEIGLANNRDLRIASFNVDQVRAQYRIQRSALAPSIDGSGGYTRKHGDVSGYPSQDEITSTYSVGIGITAYELDIFGRVRNLTGAALSEFLAAQDNQQAIRLSLIAEIATAYLNQQALLERLDLTRDTVRNRELGLSIVTQRAGQGSASGLEQSQAESLLEGAKSDLASLERNLGQADNNLALLIGQQMPNGLPQPLGLDGQGLDNSLPAGLPSQLLTRRPDVRAAEQQLKASYANIGAARAAFFPKISLTSDVGLSSNELSNLFNAGNRYWSFAPQITIPIFNAGRNKAALDVAVIRKDMNVARYEKTIQVAFREVSDELVARAPLQRELQARRKQLYAAQRSSKLANQRYELGLDGYLQNLDSQRELYGAQTALVEAKLLIGLSQINLIKSLGGDWGNRHES